MTRKEPPPEKYLDEALKSANWMENAAKATRHRKD